MTTKKFKSYPKYKDSGIQWVGMLPENWNIKKIKHNTYVKGRIGWQGLKSDEFIDVGPYLVTGTDFAGKGINWNACYHISEDRYKEDPYIQLMENDLLITKDGTIGKTAIVEGLIGKASLNSGVFVTRPKKDYITAYLFWVLNSMIFIEFINYMKSGTTISHLYQNVFVDFSFPVPTVNEQYLIASFLDRKTAHIDSLIDKKERQIELLQEMRAALISHAVTKGLDPTVPMKDSGVEWLGEIPKNWTLTSLRRCISFLTDFEANGSFQTIKDNVQIVDDDTKYAWYVRATDLENNRNHKSIESHFINIKTYYFLSKTKLFGNELLVVKRGEIGKVYLMPEIQFPASLAPNLYLIQLNTKLTSTYAFHWFRSTIGKRFLSNANKSTTIGALYKDDVKNCEILLPSLPEQLEIMDYLDIETASIDSLISKIQLSIDKLREYRTALISAAVTGKIDVRDDRDGEEAA